MSQLSPMPYLLQENINLANIMLSPPLLLHCAASPRLPRPLSAPGHARSSLLPSLHCPSLSEYGFFPPPLSVGPSLPRPSGASFPPSFFAFRCTCSLPYPSFVPWDGRPLPLSLGDPPYVTFAKGSRFPDQLPSSTRSISLVGRVVCPFVCMSVCVYVGH